MNARIVALVLLAGGCHHAVPAIERVTVRNERFEVIRILDAPPALMRFTELWATRREVESERRTLSDLPFKIDIDTGERSSSGRWLYSADGFAMILSIKVEKVYRIDDAARFDELLGIEAPPLTMRRPLPAPAPRGTAAATAR